MFLNKEDMHRTQLHRHTKVIPIYPPNFFCGGCNNEIWIYLTINPLKRQQQLAVLKKHLLFSSLKKARSTFIYPYLGLHLLVSGPNFCSISGELFDRHKLGTLVHHTSVIFSLLFNFMKFFSSYVHAKSSKPTSEHSAKTFYSILPYNIILR